MSIRRVLVYRPGSLGDTIVALPCFHRVLKSFPEGEVRVLTNAPVTGSAPPLASVLGRSGLIEGCFEYPVATRSPRRLWALVRDIRRWRAEVAVYLVPRENLLDVVRDAVFLHACGVHRIVGLPWTQDLRRVRGRADGLFEREAERLARCLVALGSIDVGDSANWDLHLTDEEVSSAHKVLSARIGAEPYIALSTGTKQAAKEWGAVNWQALAEGLLAAFPYRLVFVGANEDRALADQLAEPSTDRCVNLCGMFPVRISAAVIAGARFFVGVDSGPMHMAAAVRTPLVGIFSRLDPPGQWFPPGKEVRVLYPRVDGAMRSIRPDDVVAAAKTLSKRYEA